MLEFTEHQCDEQCVRCMHLSVKRLNMCRFHTDSILAITNIVTLFALPAWSVHIQPGTKSASEPSTIFPLITCDYLRFVFSAVFLIDCTLIKFHAIQLIK